MLRLFKRIAICALLALPGIGLAMVGKVLILGEGVLLAGLLLAFAMPIGWLAIERVV
ncbi:MAG: hypothetical protein KF847_13655 [Pirellulales bacterium]|nr:hypothetical protein [Pirellulales bacterium]